MMSLQSMSIFPEMADHQIVAGFIVLEILIEFL